MFYLGRKAPMASGSSHMSTVLGAGCYLWVEQPAPVTFVIE